MSISSIAEESALRLTPSAQAKTSMADVVANAAAHATAAVSSGLSADEAAQQGRAAGQVAQAGNAVTTIAPVNPLAQLVTYIPTETIAIYVAVQAALGEVSIPVDGRLSHANFTSRWLWMWVMVGVTVLLTAGLSFRAQRNSNRNARFKFPAFDVLAAGLAFVVWALALPSTPLRDIDGYDYSAWNSVLLLFGTVAIASSAYVLGKTVSWKKVLDSDQGVA